MRRKLIVVCFLVFLLIAFSSIVNAQTNIGTDSATKLKQQRAELREQIKESVAAKRQVAKEAVATKREEFKTRLQTIKNERKKALVERIDTKLTNVNAKHTDRFTQVLSNLQILLDKITGDVDKTDAQAAIDAAKAAVETQAAKTYSITISTETALKSDVGTVTSQLRLDLMAAHQAVIDAKQAVQALRKDSAIMKKGATTSANL